MRDSRHSHRFDDRPNGAADDDGSGKLDGLEVVLDRFQNAIARVQAEAGLEPTPPESLPFTPVNLIVGTRKSDHLVGTDQNDLIRARGGDDAADGIDGLDIVFGGRGNDQLTGEIVFGGRGDDTMSFGGEGSSLVADHWFFGGPGNDQVEGSAGDDFISGGPGDDVLHGNTGNNTLFGGSGNDVLHLPASPGGIAAVGGGTAFGGDGDDTIRGGPGADLIFGGNGDDLILPGEGNDFAFGEEGDDTLGWGALDPVGGGTLYGGPGDDVLFGRQVSPAMFGADGDDLLQVGQFEPQVSQGSDFELVYDGGLGHDTLDLRGIDHTLSAEDNISGIERILFGATLHLDAAGVLGASDETDTLIVDSGGLLMTPRIVASGAWQLTGSQDVEGSPFDQWELDGATLLVRPTIEFDLA